MLKFVMQIQNILSSQNLRRKDSVKKQLSAVWTSDEKTLNPTIEHTFWLAINRRNGQSDRFFQLGVPPRNFWRHVVFETPNIVLLNMLSSSLGKKDSNYHDSTIYLHKKLSVPLNIIVIINIVFMKSVSNSLKDTNLRLFEILLTIKEIHKSNKK